MRYIITESQMEGTFSSYLEKFRPELFNLDKIELTRDDGSIYGYEFINNNTFNLYFNYEFEPDDPRSKKYLNKTLPELRVTRKLWNELEGIFGETHMKLIVPWFENQYGLLVKSLIGSSNLQY